VVIACARALAPARRARRRWLAAMPGLRRLTLAGRLARRAARGPGERRCQLRVEIARPRIVALERQWTGDAGRVRLEQRPPPALQHRRAQRRSLDETDQELIHARTMST